MAIDGPRRDALTLRGVARAYGISRGVLADAVEAGSLRASRLGKRNLTILRADVENWLRGHAIRPTAHAEQVVERVLARQAAT